ncbi:hypothetical protein Pmar_PMAR020621 [Perkinsus marinus ATCC 50983]|uniref:Uncharacterized protein n=1 Tax=Perkinsus marinus (strain ATCC 50983 / TXsc) TaxID=423536 RepID=C5L7J7_PERM5|nr:hypothetical protein Pmar_PMAR020621 [Perkinsus marinus ATCC 50983]EER07459.1 hypothetical protein Pmar_PMAR020621 [Perkinsus marinus ATCC 50983]|eukprot:XP_002775643.1 hypothetical protein Pmar_PMAR020621 [Perkinsus marinus ATCC 50983]
MQNQAPATPIHAAAAPAHPLISPDHTPVHDLADIGLGGAVAAVTPPPAGRRYP